MGENGSRRKIRALTAIVETMITALYGTLTREQATVTFAKLVADGDPLATAISNELTTHEIDRALAATECALESHEEVLNAIPAFHHLNHAQREQARVMRVAEEAVDGACEAGNADPEGAFIEVMLRDLEAQRGESPEIGATSRFEDRVEKLPEPWRHHARQGIESVRNRVGAHPSDLPCPSEAPAPERASHHRSMPQGDD